MNNFVTVSDTVWAHVGGPKSWRCWAPPVVIGDVADPL